MRDRYEFEDVLKYLLCDDYVIGLASARRMVATPLAGDPSEALEARQNHAPRVAGIENFHCGPVWLIASRLTHVAGTAVCCSRVC